ncbi:MAG: hypothetical protein WDN49_23975 [Acetobacteraceae bacterium]
MLRPRMLQYGVHALPEITTGGGARDDPASPLQHHVRRVRTAHGPC